MIETAVKVLGQQQIAADCMLLAVKAPEIVHRAAAGQFAQLKCGQTYDPLLRRPLSFHALERDSGVLRFLYQLRGKGTKLLKELSADSSIDILGPLGKGFNQEITEGETAVLVGGGIGIAPLYQLAADLIKRDIKVITVFGAASKEQLYRTQVFRSLKLDLILATEDGSLGHKGFVTEPLKEVLPEAGAVYACGPKPMLKQAALLASKFNIPCEVSIDTRMACGTGACLGCVVKLKHEASENGWRYGRVCHEGPVFNAEEVYWGE